jgi:hypothetical protein
MYYLIPFHGVSLEVLYSLTGERLDSERVKRKME